MLEWREGQCSMERPACESKAVGTCAERSRPSRLLEGGVRTALKDLRSLAKIMTLILLTDSDNQRSQLFDGQLSDQNWALEEHT